MPFVAAFKALARLGEEAGFCNRNALQLPDASDTLPAAHLIFRYRISPLPGNHPGPMSGADP